MNEVPYLESEDEVQAWLKSEFEEAGWTAIREVSPAFSDYRADLIVQHQDYGWIGIEVKHCSTSDNSGGVLAEGFRQITQQYRGRTYINEQIDLWAIAPYFYSKHQDREHDYGAPEKFVREFFCYFGIGYINFSRSQLMIDFAYSNRDTKIWVSDVSGRDNEYHDSYGDIDSVENSVSPKLNRVESP